MVTEAGCSTEPPCQTRNSQGRNPFSPHVDDLRIYRDVEQSTSVSVRDILTGRRYRIPIPQSDIDAHINFSYMRFLVSIFSLLLVISDIPRTGFSTDLPTFFPHVAPEVYMYYGPYNFPLSHINRSRENNTTSRFDGHTGGVPIDSVSLWAHKYDTLSIAPRAVADYLRVKSFPPCVLYKGACSSPRISLETTFTMMDDLISALHNRYFQHSTDKGLPMTFYTKNRWVDRLHHFLLGKWFTAREDNRLSMIHHFASNDLAPVCSPHRKGPARPLMCDDTIAWHCESPVENAKTRVSIGDHVDLRLELLRQEYPTLKVELFLFSSHSGLVSTRPKLLPQVQFNTNLFQVVAFIRGQQCTDDTTCETVFIDDYRYERATLESNAKLWAPILTALRGTAQGYVWLRLTILWWGCFRARSCELKYCHSSLWTRCLVTWRTFFLIPSHVIIYSSWFPVCCYALAHLIDCDITHLVSDNFWNSLNGFVDFNLLRYIEVASVQMRNVWWLALAWKVGLLLANSHLMIERIRQWQPFDGVLGIRGMFITAPSWLTIFSFLRALRFRNTAVLDFLELPRHISWTDTRLVTASHSVPEFGRSLDLRTLLMASLLVFTAVYLVESVIKSITQRASHFVFCRSFLVPFTAGKLFSESMLGLVWDFRLKGSASRQPSIRRTIRSVSNFLNGTPQHTVLRPQPSVRGRRCLVCDLPPTPFHWRDLQGCKRHQHITRIEKRIPQVSSGLRLINITMLSDPWNIYRVYGPGCGVFRVYLYRVQAGDAASASDELFLLPSQLFRRFESSQWELVAVIDGSKLPWIILVGCG